MWSRKKATGSAATKIITDRTRPFFHRRVGVRITHAGELPHGASGGENAPTAVDGVRRAAGEDGVVFDGIRPTEEMPFSKRLQLGEHSGVRGIFGAQS